MPFSIVAAVKCSLHQRSEPRLQCKIKEGDHPDIAMTAGQGEQCAMTEICVEEVRPGQ